MTITPGWDAFKKSAQQAASSPLVWGNLLAASLLQIDNLDRKVSDHLRENTPLFGSAENAAKRSDDFRDLNELVYQSTALLVPGPENSGDWLVAKTKLLAAEWLAVKSARAVTKTLKSSTERTRPNDENDRSFPSGHVTTASSQAEMAKLNIKYLPLGPSTQELLSYSLNGLTALTAWARVEAGVHYPADVLSGWAVGYFIAQLANTFIAPQENIIITPMAMSRGTGFQVVVLY